MVILYKNIILSFLLRREDEMSIVKRFSNIMTSNVKQLFNESKDPMTDMTKYMRELEEDLRTVKSEMEASVTNKERRRREIDEYEEKIEKYERYFEKFTEQGKSRDARIYLSKKEELMPKLEELKETYNLEKDNVDKMKKIHEKLSMDIDLLKSTINRGTVDKGNGYSKVEEVQQKVDKMVCRAEAIEEINNISNSSSDLDKEFDALLRQDSNS